MNVWYRFVHQPGISRLPTMRKDTTVEQIVAMVHKIAEKQGRRVLEIHWEYL